MGGLRVGAWNEGGMGEGGDGCARAGEDAARWDVEGVCHGVVSSEEVVLWRAMLEVRAQRDARWRIAWGVGSGLERDDAAA